MGEITRMVPKTGQPGRAFIEQFLEQWGNDIEGVVIIAKHKDGEVVDGWSKEVPEDVMFWLGALEQIKLDFWNTVFQKRNDLIGG